MLADQPETTQYTPLARLCQQHFQPGRRLLAGQVNNYTWDQTMSMVEDLPTEIFGTSFKVNPNDPDYSGNGLQDEARMFLHYLKGGDGDIEMKKSIMNKIYLKSQGEIQGNDVDVTLTEAEMTFVTNKSFPLEGVDFQRFDPEQIISWLNDEESINYTAEQTIAKLEEMGTEFNADDVFGAAFNAVRSFRENGINSTEQKIINKIYQEAQAEIDGVKDAVDLSAEEIRYLKNNSTYSDMRTEKFNDEILVDWMNDVFDLEIAQGTAEEISENFSAALKKFNSEFSGTGTRVPPPSESAHFLDTPGGVLAFIGGLVTVLVLLMLLYFQCVFKPKGNEV